MKEIKNLFSTKLITNLIVVVLVLFSAFILATENSYADFLEKKYDNVTNTAKGTGKDKYIYNSDDDNIEDIFNFSYKDVINTPFTWLSNRKSYIVVQEKPNGTNQIWMNAPNLQLLLFNKYSSLSNSGYIGNGIDSYEQSRDSYFSIIKLPERKNAHTAMQRYGFRIPNPSYVGEYPRIGMSLSGVIADDNALAGFKNKILSLFTGGNVISAPNKDDMGTLYYIQPSDYASKYKFTEWISAYWDSVMAQMPDNQVLCDTEDVDENGKDKDGNIWVKQNIINKDDFKDLKNANKINAKLKEICGDKYENVITNIIAYGTKNNISPKISNQTIRVMPFESNTLTQADKNAIKKADPRVTLYKSRTFGANSLLDKSGLNFGIYPIIRNFVLSSTISVAGVISEFTVFLNSSTNFSTLEKLGIDVMFLWKTPIAKVFMGLVAIVLVVSMIRLMISSIKSGSMSKMFSKVLGTFVILGLMNFMIVAPDKFLNSTKILTSLLFNFGSIVNSDVGVNYELTKGGSIQEKSDCSYWLPYFSLWSNYHTGHSLTDDSSFIKKDNKNNEPEQKRMEYPKVGEQECLLWSANLADSFTSGTSINKNAYRTVDHFMAPRLKYEGENKRPIVSIADNPNYTKDVQSSIDLGILIFVYVIFFGVLIKFILFVECVYDTGFLGIKLFQASLKKYSMKPVFMKFVYSFLYVFATDFLLAIFVFMSTNFTGIIGLLFAIMSAVALYKYTVLLTETRSYRPMLLSKIVRAIKKNRENRRMYKSINAE